MTAPRRLHPATVAVRLVRQLPSTLLGLPAFLAVAGRGDLLLIAAVTLVAVGVGAVATWLRWRAFTYAVDGRELVIAEGVVAKSRRSIPLLRIQDVSIERRALQRLFGLATVRVETGGNDADEGLLDSVSVGEAARLRDLLRRSPAHDAASAGTTPVEQPDPRERTIFAMSPRRVLLMGLFRFSLVWLAGIYALLQTFGGVLDLDREAVARWLGVAEREVRGGGGAVLAVAALIPVAVALGVATGVVRTVLTESGFRLDHAEGRFRRKRGLLTRTEVVVATRRVQLALVERGLVSGRLGWAALSFQTLGGSDDMGGRQAMAPFARDDEIMDINDAAGLPHIAPDALRPVAAGHAVRMLIGHVAPPLAAVLAASWFAPFALLGLAVLPLPIAAALLARRRHRHGLRDDALQVTRGVLTRREWVVPLDKVQAVSVSRTWLQRRLGTATVRVGTAGAKGSGRPDIVDVARDDAAAIAMRLIRAG